MLDIFPHMIKDALRENGINTIILRGSPSLLWLIIRDVFVLKNFTPV